MEVLQKLENELKLRGFSENTINSYLFYNKKFLEFCKKRPEEVSELEIKNFVAKNWALFLHSHTPPTRKFEKFHQTKWDYRMDACMPR